MVNYILVQYWSPDGVQWRIQDFPKVGAPTLQGRQHTILPNSRKNCIQLKEFGPGGGWGRGGNSLRPFRSANGIVYTSAPPPIAICSKGVEKVMFSIMSVILFYSFFYFYSLGRGYHVTYHLRPLLAYPLRPPPPR